jgi:hypothetical protein
VVEPDQLAGRVALRVEQGGDQPVVTGVGVSVGGADGDAGVDDAHVQATDGR